MKKSISEKHNEHHDDLNPLSATVDADGQASLVDASAGKIDSSQRFSRFINVKSILLLIAALAIITVVSQMQKPLPPVQTKAATGQASITLRPAVIDLTPDQTEQTVQVWVNTDKDAGFIRVDVVFDPEKLMLKNEPVFGLDSLNVLFPLTTKAAANTSGLISYVGAIGTGNDVVAPTGAFLVGSFIVEKKISTPNVMTMIGVGSDSQLVDRDAMPFNLAHHGATVTMNSDGTMQPESTLNPTESIVQGRSGNRDVQLETQIPTRMPTQTISADTPSQLRDREAVREWLRTRFSSWWSRWRWKFWRHD